MPTVRLKEFMPIKMIQTKYGENQALLSNIALLLVEKSHTHTLHNYYIPNSRLMNLNNLTHLSFEMEDL
jgi:hypothetical protein